MNDSLFGEVFNDLFTKEEWDLWAKGEFNLFDNYVERIGMSKEDADRLRDGFRQPPPLKQKSLTKEEVKAILKEQ